MEIYIIKTTLVEKATGLTKETKWSNLYAVKTEEEARRDCIKMQNESNNAELNKYYKFSYMYEKISLF